MKSIHLYMYIPIHMAILFYLNTNLYTDIYVYLKYHHMNGLSELINWINNVSNNSLGQKLLRLEMCPFKYTWEMGNGSQLTPIGDTMAARTMVWTFKSIWPLFISSLNSNDHSVSYTNSHSLSLMESKYCLVW